MSQHARLYDRRWRRRRAAQLRAEPLCRFCRRRGRVVAATVADHIVPHRGDPVLFEGPLQSLCAGCHNIVKQSMERSGRVPGVGIDGVPLDPNHAWNREACS